MLKYYFLFLLLNIIYSSCAPFKPHYFDPNMQNVPLITVKGNGNINYGGGLIDNSFSLNSAYGITNSLAVMLNMHTAGKNVFGTPFNDHNSYLFETGFGLYYNLTSWLLIDLYPTIGLGNLKNQFAPTGSPVYISGKLSTTLLRYSAQPSINLHFKYGSLSFSSRFSRFTYEDVKGDLVYESIDQIQFLKDRSINYFVEPAITIKGGFKNFKAQIQWHWSHNFSNINIEGTYYTVYLGFNYMFIRKDSKKKDMIIN